MTKEEKAGFRGAGRVAFLAREKEIKEMIDAGHPKKNVYRKYGALLNISYVQFARYVSKFITNKEDEKKGEKAAQRNIEPKTKDKELSVTEIYNLPSDKKDTF